uniref:30S ribosomal protein S11 n=1 Tax=Nephromyces sp. ex Molgula occidentalis TaxID=2544991 RepID=A0A5C1H7V6_9APIC|nr:30S ribosomal protein S11 [Nephromyces sp. ex Molgula occidentalis]
MNCLKNNKIINFYIKSTKKNTFISLFETNFKIIKVYSFGNFGFKGRHKNTPFSSAILTSKTVIEALKLNYNKINIIFNGNFFLQRQIILKTILTTNYKSKYLKINLILDTTSLSFNGCKQLKYKNY